MSKKKSLLLTMIVIGAIVFSIVSAGCTPETESEPAVNDSTTNEQAGTQPAPAPEKKEESEKVTAPEEREPAEGILLSTTIGPVDAGVIDALIDAYTAENPDRTVRYLSRGTGAALSLAEGGNIDLVIAHAKSLEEEFVAGGFGTERIDMMYNDFVLVGPEADPADTKSAGSIEEALQKIEASGSHFVSRGDNSGTNVKEMEIWKSAGIEPSGDWYEVYEKGNEGNKATILHTNETSAYTVIDRATVITNKDELDNLVVLYESDEIMLNYMSIIPVNADNVKGVHAEAAANFIEFLTGDDAQKIIEEFGVDVYGEPLFFPNAK